MPHITYVNGRYLPHADAFVHIEDRGYQFADGVYEVICVRRGSPVDYAPHMRRLERSLRELRMAAPSSMAALTVAVRETVRRNYIDNGYIYLQVNRGVAPRNHPFPNPPVKPSVVITAKAGGGPSEDAVERGGTVVSAPDNRWERVDVKSVGLLANVLVKQLAAEAKAYETLLYLPDGTVTEASASNAWMVTPDKTLVTYPDKNGGILSGITRGTLIKLARDAGYKVEERPFTMEETKTAKEVFVSGTTTFVMPIVRIDERPIANGAPGTVALDLRRRYIAYAENVDPSTAWKV